MSNPRDFARHLRRNMTDAERTLWRHLRAHRFLGQKFRRQQPIGPYILDFVHFGARLIIEADGSQHGDAVDVERDLGATETVSASCAFATTTSCSALPTSSRRSTPQSRNRTPHSSTTPRTLDPETLA